MHAPVTYHVPESSFSVDGNIPLDGEVYLHNIHKDVSGCALQDEVLT